MKNIYQKPAFSFVALSSGTNSAACDFTMDFGWQVCPVEVIPGFAVVFTADPCNFDNGGGFSVCLHTGPANSNVFGS